MLIRLLHFVVMWLNKFPLATGISTQFSPREFILCHCLDYNNHCRAPFGAYCKTHEENDATNSMDTQGTLSICLGPTGNLQGSCYFLSLVTGKLIKRWCLTELPVPQAIIDRVAHFAKNSPSSDIIFTDHHRQPYHWPSEEIIGSNKSQMAPYSDCWYAGSATQAHKIIFLTSVSFTSRWPGLGPTSRWSSSQC